MFRDGMFYVYDAGGILTRIMYATDGVLTEICTTRDPEHGQRICDLLNRNGLVDVPLSEEVVEA